jgi:hypothetical protein
VRKPLPPLRLVDAEGLEPTVRVLGDPRRTPLLVLEDEHSDRAGLPVPRRRENGLGDPVHGCAQSACDRLRLASGPRPEKGDRDVQVLERNDPDAFHGELGALPGGDGICGRVGQAEAEKEA